MSIDLFSFPSIYRKFALQTKSMSVIICLHTAEANVDSFRMFKHPSLKSRRNSVKTLNTCPMSPIVCNNWFANTLRYDRSHLAGRSVHREACFCLVQEKDGRARSFASSKDRLIYFFKYRSPNVFLLAIRRPWTRSRKTHPSTIPSADWRLGTNSGEPGAKGQLIQIIFLRSSLRVLQDPRPRWAFTNGGRRVQSNPRTNSWRIPDFNQRTYRG